MHNQLLKFFQPSITFYWRGKFGKGRERFYPDTNKDWLLFKQIAADAKIKTSSFSLDEYDTVLEIAGKYGISLTTIGGPDEPVIDGCLNSVTLAEQHHI